MGVLFFVLGVAHLAATPHIPFLLNGQTPKTRAFALGPTLLNHMLVGFLLVPLGYATWLAAAKENVSTAWAWRLLFANSLTVLTMPVLIVALMRDHRFYQAPLFVTEVAIAAITAIMVPTAGWFATRPEP